MHKLYYSRLFFPFRHFAIENFTIQYLSDVYLSVIPDFILLLVYFHFLLIIHIINNLWITFFPLLTLNWYQNHPDVVCLHNYQYYVRRCKYFSESVSFFNGHYCFADDSNPFGFFIRADWQWETECASSMITHSSQTEVLTSIAPK